MKNIKEFYERYEGKIKLVTLIISGICLLVNLILGWSDNEGVASLILAWVAIVLCGLPIIIGAMVGIIRDHDITADLLVSLALIGSLILKEWFAAGEVAFIMQIGSLLEDFTSQRAKKGIEKLIKITPQKANLLIYGEEKVIDSSNVNIGDLLRVKAGELIPVDGIIVEGNTSIDQSAMTGESIPVEKGIGDILMSGTLNQSGAIIMKASKKAEDSSLQRMVKLAESADAQKAHIVRRANKWAAWLVVISLSTAIIAGLVIGLINSDFWLGFSRAVTVLVVFCPCAFVLATPTAISAGIGNASRHGIIIQSGEALERVASSNIAIFDKTGTLTKGKPVVTKVESVEDINKFELIRIAASGETLSNHPLAKAIVEYNKEKLYEVSNHQTLPGIGISFDIDDNHYLVGKSDSKISDSTVVRVKRNDEVIGDIYIEDEIKNNAMEMVSELKNLGIRVAMLTGDNEEVAGKVALELGIDEYVANCSPESKMKYIKSQEEAGNKASMFGDGVNDSLALRSAFAGIAMGGIGSDVAIESADAVIVYDNLDSIPYLFQISRKTRTRITINLCISMALNVVAVVLSILGILDTVWGALFHNCGSVAVVISAFLLLFWKEKKR